MSFSFLSRVSAGSRITRTVSAGSHFSWTIVSAGSKRSQTVSAEAKYDGQSLQEAKFSELIYTLCTCAESESALIEIFQKLTIKGLLNISEYAQLETEKNAENGFGKKGRRKLHSCSNKFEKN